MLGCAFAAVCCYDIKAAASCRTPIINASPPLPDCHLSDRVLEFALCLPYDKGDIAGLAHASKVR